MLFALLLLSNAAISTSVVQAAVRVEVGPELPGGIPAYARFGGPGPGSEFLHTEEWAAIVFYREPKCVPPDFNLLTMVDIPAVFRCPLTVAGFEIWENGPPPLSSDAAPLVTESHGLGAVPVWFVSWPELQEQIAGGVLTITDLASMASLQVGSADFFRETMQLQSASVATHLGIVAHGHLADGRSFQFEAQGVLGNPQNTVPSVKNVRISFK